MEEEPPDTSLDYDERPRPFRNLKPAFLGILVAAGGFYLVQNKDRLLGSSGSVGAFDAQGRPKILLFTEPDCGKACTWLPEELKERAIPFEEINVATAEGKRRFEQYGGQDTLPFTVVGNKAFVSVDADATESVLAENFGWKALSAAQAAVMRNHFSADGKPRVVLYGTTWCPHCAKVRAYMEAHGIPYTFRDVESSDAIMNDFRTLGGNGYPLIYVGYRRIAGENEDEVAQAAKELLHL